MRRLSRKMTLISVFTALVLTATALTAAGQDVFRPTALTAEEAFDAVQMQKDPGTNMPADVILVDVRTRAEYFWVGTAAAVTRIDLKNGQSVVPDLGKVKLEHNGKFVTYHVKGNYQRTLVQKVKEITTAAIAINVPYHLWDETTRDSAVPNPNFSAHLAAIAGDTKPVLILFCRSGGRTDGQNCVSALDTSLFSAIYEIDQAWPATNVGGLEGSDYSRVFNGYRGFPERDTLDQASPSVSWKDAGLPIKIGVKPPVVPARLR